MGIEAKLLNEEPLNKIKMQILKHEGCKKEILKDYYFSNMNYYHMKFMSNTNGSCIAYQIAMIIALMFDDKYWVDIFESIIIDNPIISDLDKFSIFIMLYERTFNYCNTFKKGTFKKIRNIYQSKHDEKIDRFINNGYLILYRGISSSSAPLCMAHSYSLNKYYACGYEVNGQNGKLIVRMIKPNKIIAYVNSKENLFTSTNHVLAFYEDTEPLPPEYTISDPLKQYQIYIDIIKKCFI